MSRSSWTFITNHGAVLAIIGNNAQITARDIASYLNITERSVQRIIRDLEQERYISRRRQGRVNHYRVNHERPLRREDQRDVQIADLLKVLD
jgi:DNA-binding Lrp family transcriptional regulator